MPAKNPCAAVEAQLKETQKEIERLKKQQRSLKQAKARYKNLYEEAKRGEIIYRSIIHSSADAIAIFDLKGKVNYISPSFTDVFGWTIEEVHGKHIPFLPESEKEMTTSLFVELTLNGIPCLGLETKRYRKDGAVVDVSLSASRYLDHEGKPEGMFMILHDISDRKKLENQLAQAQKMQALGTLAGGIAHDFNNILFNIIGYAEMIRADVDENPMVRKNLKELLSAANRAKELVKHIQTFSRQREQERKPLRLQPILKEALKLLRASIPSTIEIREQIDDECGAILADPTQIHQMIMNFGTNAFHAMSEKGGYMDVSIDEMTINSPENAPLPQLPPGQYVRLTVSDTGHGMDTSVMERIFDPFFTTKGPGDGTGMGLSVIHGIVTNSGGQIAVKSKPGKGSKFTVFLPRVDEDTSVAPKTVFHEPVPRGRESLLLVDDEEQSVRMIHQMLERLGYQVTSRTSSIEALEVFRNRPDDFDAVITDLTMPNMTGIELAQELTAVKADVPIIVCTGFSETITQDQARKLGIRGHIMKPAVTREIARTIRKVLSDEDELKRRILLVDDAQEIRSMLKDALEKMGYEVFVASDGKKAKEVLENTMINLVLTDLRMPIMSGFELLAYVNANFPALPVIVMSAYGTPEVKRKLMQMGTIMVIDKPVELDALQQNLTDAFTNGTHEGSVTGISISSFLQLIEMEGKSCILEAHGDRNEEGFFYFVKGELFDAFCGDVRGEDAALKMMGWDNVLLNFKTLPKKKMVHNIRKDLLSVIMEGLRQKDEVPLTPAKEKEIEDQMVIPSLQVDEVVVLDNIAKPSTLAAQTTALRAPRALSPKVGGMLTNMLKNMSEELENVYFVGVIDRDGFDVVGLNSTALEHDRVAGMSALVVKTADSTISDLQILGLLKEIISKTDDAWMLNCILDEQYFLSVMVGQSATIGHVRLVANKYVRKFRSVLDNNKK